MKKVKSITVIIMTFMLIINTLNIQMFSVKAEDQNVSKSICGVWEGTYDGTENSSKVERKIRLDIDNCTEDGTIEGIATVNEGKDAKYYFEGKLDSETGKINFAGKEWLYNPKNYSFTSFSGNVDFESLQMSGTADQEGRGFSLTKVSDSFESQKVDTTSLVTDYNGEYDGKHDSRIVRRDIEIHIDNISEDGKIKGTAIISPSSNEDIAYGANGSYYFSGNLNLRNGKISLQGYEWIDYPVQYQNFEFVKLNGYIDLKNKKIIGTSEEGIWTMEALDYNSVETKSGFTLGTDSNSFIHNNSEASMSGFRGVNTYAIDDAYFQKLTQNSTFSEKNKIKKAMERPWHGSCYGIAMTMGLLYENYINISDLTDSKNAKTYYSMPYPTNDKKLLNTINYYQLSQNLENGGKKSAVVSAAYNNSVFTGLINWLCNYDSLSVFLKKLVNYSSTDHVELLGFSTKESGHAVLVTSCKYDAAKKQYQVQIFDENTVKSSMSKGYFSYMTIPKDFSSFSYTDATGAAITNETYQSIYFLDWNSLGDIVKTSKKTSTEHAKFDFLIDDNFKVSNDAGEYIQYKDNKFSGNMKVYSMDTVDADNGVHVIIETDKTNSVKLSDIKTDIDMEVYNNDEFLALDGKNITGAEMELGEGIKIHGNDYSFKAYISTDKIKEDETGLVSISANAKADTIVSKKENEVTVSSDENLSNIERKTYVGTKIDSSNDKNTSNDKDTSEVLVKTEEKEPQSVKKNIKIANVKLQKNTYVYNRKYKQPEVYVTIGKTKLIKGTDYKVTYKNQKEVGTATVIITGIGNYTGTINKTFKIIPKGTTVTKLTAKKKKLVLKWKKQTDSTSGYKIQYSTSKKFTKKTTRTKYVSKNKTTNITISKLKSKKKYYVRICTYKDIKGQKYTSTWSKVKSRRTR